MGAIPVLLFVALVGFAAPARAELCAGTVLIAEWKAGSSAYARKDYAAALAHLDPLARAGFAPALLFRGRMYAGGLGAPRDLDRAITDFDIASREGLESAGGEIDEVGKTIALQRLTDLREASKRVAFDIRGCAGKSEPIVPRYLHAKNVKLTPAQFAPWWTALDAYAANSSPETIVYLGSVPAFGFIKWDKLVGTLRQPDPILVINPALVAGVESQKVKQQQALDMILPSARAVVNEYAMIQTGVFDLDRYKGREFVAWPTEDSKSIFQSLRTAIDMIEALPGELKSYGERIRRILYRPRMPYSISEEAIVNSEVDDTDKANPAVVFIERPESYAPGYYAPDIVNAGYVAAHGQEKADGLRQDEFCVLMRLRIQTAMALDLAPDKIAATRGYLDSHGCAR